MTSRWGCSEWDRAGSGRGYPQHPMLTKDQVGSTSVEAMEPGQTSDKTTENVVRPAAIFICKDQHLILSYLPQNVTRALAESLDRLQTTTET